MPLALRWGGAECVRRSALASSTPGRNVQFLDEPTSGLDARSAAAVMSAVRNVASNGRTVMVTIHQPSIEIFESFDRLVLLGMGGESIYVGKLGDESRHLVDYFQVCVCFFSLSLSSLSFFHLPF